MGVMLSLFMCFFADFSPLFPVRVFCGNKIFSNFVILCFSKFVRRDLSLPLSSIIVVVGIAVVTLLLGKLLWFSGLRRRFAAKVHCWRRKRC